MAREAGGSPREWLAVDETAAAFLSRSLAARPPILLPPPLHRAPLRPGNVVEIAGPSNSGKSQLLLMAAVQCILPKEWEGVYFGGLGKEVMYIDLDCRFDVLRLAQILRNRIAEGCGSAHPINEQFVKDGTEDILFTDCMKRFFYVRCYSSSELIVVLKTVYSQSKARRALGVGIYFLMLDSIGAFYWIDRCSQPTRDSKGKTQSLQSITESVVQEIRKFLQLQPILVLVSKAHIYGEGITTSNDFQSLICLETEEPLFFDGDQLNVQSLVSIKEEAHAWPFSSVANGRWLIIACVVDSTHDWQGTSKFLTEDSTVLRYSKREEEINTSCREYMPSVWQTFVTHRIKLQDLVQESGISSEQESEVLSIHTSEWVRPSLNIKEKFYIRDEVYRLFNQRLERSDGDWRTTRRYAADALEICQVLTRHMPETKVFVIPTEHNKA